MAPFVANRHVLQCMDLWSGNRSVDNEASTPGMEIFVSSQPYGGESRGGDVHYVSLCAGGVVTRLIVADVSGHGAAVADTSQSLRALMVDVPSLRLQFEMLPDGFTATFAHSTMSPGPSRCMAPLVGDGYRHICETAAEVVNSLVGVHWLPAMGPSCRTGGFFVIRASR